jgi:hypothetical protein
MKKEHIQYLIEQYNKAQLTTSEEQELEQAIEQGFIPLSAFEDLYELDQKLEEALYIQPKESMALAFFRLLEAEKAKPRRPSSAMQAISGQFWRKPVYQWGIAALLVLSGIGAGRWLLPAPQQSELAQLSTELQEMKEVMLLTMLEQKSTSKRLKAVSLTQEMEETSAQVTEALLYTLRNDRNTNVRLATLDALVPYTDDPAVRQALIESIAYQRSPHVQLALAELMVSLQEKGSIAPLQQIIEDENTPEEVKVNIKKNIDILL